MSKEKSQVTDENQASDYDTAVSLLKRNPPEQRLDFQLPYSEFLRLEATWSMIKSKAKITEDARYPYLAYNSLTDTVTVVTVPRELHEVAAVELRREIMNSVNRYLSIHNPDAIGTIVDSGSTKRKYGRGHYARSSKQSDGSFKYNDTIMVVVEVGCSQKYDALCRDKRLWMDGYGAKVCILVRFEESPRFRNPSSPMDCTNDLVAERRTMMQHVNETGQSHYGPISYRGHKWVGTLKVARIEVWRANSCKEYTLIEDGTPRDSLPNSIGLDISDFYPDDEWQLAGIEHGDITIDSAVYVKFLKTAVVNMAVDRFADFIGRQR
ncbi:hypothetical protein V1520DRAFT_343118 [Lipomyces starkeyi]|uniref:Uncharacterized protein n=1 Tax=Lipomyces starkeyi NRRL Y-11557 TaxID=675824 RepID=A0A1E3PW25_LIPST|nr:hypothetical protein LIPSTDRAFT_75715 [Lipomyces starkeyi NRRL Y-11557]